MKKVIQYLIRNNIHRLAMLFKKGVHLSTILTWRCNHRCEYCPITIMSNDWIKEPDADINYVLETIDKFPVNLKSVGITGGEPTLHPQFTEYTNDLLNRGHFVTVFTNLARYERILKVKKTHRFKIYATNHESTSAEKFIKKVDAIRKDYHIICREFKNHDPQLDFSTKRDIIELAEFDIANKNVLLMDTHCNITTTCYNRIKDNI